MNPPKTNFQTVISGNVFQGARKAGFFTGLDWVKIQCREKLGFIPFPGTLNLEINPPAVNCLEKIYPDEFLKNVRPFSDTGPVLRLLHAHKIRIGIVTSTPQKNIKDKMKLLDQAGVADLIDVVISAGDTEWRKPFPDPLILCRDRMGFKSDQCVYVGDTGIDISAGKAAGMKTIGVLTGFETWPQLQEKNPDAIIASISDLPGALNI